MGGEAKTGGGATSGADAWAAGRARYLDNLKVILIAAIIVGHAVIGYAGSTDAWSYSDVREVTLAPVTEAVVVPATFLSAFVIPLLFLVAGLLTRPSLERKGVAPYVRDRLLRLGVPFVTFAILTWPLAEYALFRRFGAAPPLGEYLRAEGTLDTGVLWFVGTLLIFSLAYAGYAHLRGDRAQAPTTAPLTARHLLLLALGVAAGSFLVRLALPVESDNRYVDLNMWEWPACAAMFGLGIAAAPRGWVSAVPDRLRRVGRAATLGAGVGAVALVVGLVALGASPEDLAGGWSWPALAFATGEAVLAVFGAVWLLGAAQRHLDRPFAWIPPAAGRAAYGAFMLQGPVLIGLALALRPLPLPAEVKALAVAAGGVTGSFALAWVLISRVPVVGRIF